LAAFACLAKTLASDDDDVSMQRSAIPMSIAEAGRGPLFPAHSKKLRYTKLKETMKLFYTPVPSGWALNIYGKQNHMIIQTFLEYDNIISHHYIRHQVNCSKLELLYQGHSQEFAKWGNKRDGLGDGSPPAGSRGKAPVEVWGQIPRSRRHITHAEYSTEHSHRSSQIAYVQSPIILIKNFQLRREGHAPMPPWLRHCTLLVKYYLLKSYLQCWGTCLKLFPLDTEVSNCIRT